MVVPRWEQCLNYEQELRNEAIRLCTEQGRSIQQTLWMACATEHHRMEHWCMLLFIANLSTPSSSLQKRVLEFEKRLKKRSRSPHRRPGQPHQIANGILPPALHALSAPQKGTKGNGKGTGKGAKGKGTQGQPQAQ